MSDHGRHRLQLIKGTGGSNSDPHLLTAIWNREWTAGEHGGFAFTTETARVDVVNPQRPRHLRVVNPQRPRHLRVFAGGSRTIADREPIESKLRALPRSAVILTSRTNGVSAAVRDATIRLGLRLEVWTAMTDRYLTAADAYFARDEEMIRSADRVLAFWDGESAGTAHELTYAMRLSKPIDLVLVDRSESPNRYPGGDAA
jgi:hypothetical protein